MTFIEKFEYLMKTGGYKNRSQVSKLSGIPYTTIDGFYKKGTENIRRTTLIKLSDFFNCSLEYLVDDNIEDAHYGKTASFKVEYEEVMHLKKYRSLNPEGKEKAENYIDDLISTGKYNTAPNDMETAKELIDRERSSVKSITRDINKA